ncbi:MAG: PAS domain-containing protein [Deltaproteobacteria bacterium]
MDRENSFNKEDLHSAPSAKASPRRLIIILVLSIVAIEALVMEVLHLLVLAGVIGYGTVLETIIDPMLLTMMLSPVLYAFVFRPMIKAMNELKASEDSLRFEKARVISILEAMEDGVYIVNRDYDIEYANPVIEREFGQYKGRKCFSYFHDRTQICPWCPNQRVFAGDVVRWEWHSLKNGKTYDLIDSPLKNPDNTISKLEIFRDITQRIASEKEVKQRLEELERFQRATIGREFKIKELKDRVKVLEDKIKGFNDKGHQRARE